MAGLGMEDESALVSLSSSNKNLPLGLPEGSVRAVLTIGALVIAGGLLMFGKTVPDWFVGLITLVVRDYFGTRGAS